MFIFYLEGHGNQLTIENIATSLKGMYVIIIEYYINLNAYTRIIYSTQLIMTSIQRIYIYHIKEFIYTFLINLYNLFLYYIC